MLKECHKQGQSVLLGSEWKQEKVDKARDETINKTYSLYKQHELNKNSEKTVKTLGKDVINLYSSVISWVAKI